MRQLLRQDHLYDICLMDWNISSHGAIAARRLCFHLARPGYTPTEGCVAISRGDMLRLLPLVDAHTIVRVL